MVHINSATVNGEGLGMVTWQASARAEGWDGEGWCRTFHPDGSWSKATPLALGGEPGFSHQVNPGCGSTPVLLGQEGEGWVVGMADRYHHRDGDRGLVGSVFTATPIRGGEVAGEARWLEPVCRDLDGFKVADNGRDTLLGAWLEQGAAGGPRLFVNRFLAGRGWASAAAELPVSGTHVDGSYLAGAVTPNGTTCLAWVTRSRAAPSAPRLALQVASAGPGRDWSDPMDLAEPGALALGQLTMAAGPGETAALAWTSLVPGATSMAIQVSLFRPDTGWSRPEIAARAGASIKDGTSLAFTGPDQVVLGYLASDQADAETHELRTVWFSAGRWSPPQSHGQPSAKAQFGLGSDGKGHAVVVWREERRGRGATVLASVAEASGSWQPAVALPSGIADAGSVEHVAAAMGPDGTACALWDTEQEGRRTGWASLLKPGWRRGF
jgi:hypothetical protein